MRERVFEREREREREREKARALNFCGGGVRLCTFISNGAMTTKQIPPKCNALRCPRASSSPPTPSPCLSCPSCLALKPKPFFAVVTNFALKKLKRFQESQIRTKKFDREISNQMFGCCCNSFEFHLERFGQNFESSILGCFLDL